jgi:hypothetical protein
MLEKLTCRLPRLQRHRVSGPRNVQHQSRADLLLWKPRPFIVQVSGFMPPWT